MAVSEAHVRASVKWNKNRGSITVRPEKSEDEAIRAAAQKSGVGLQDYVLTAIREKMSRDAESSE